ncbi:MAG: hypothetical protein QOJ40_1412, partial [Verrucomicrobiota bacterium]
RRLLDRLSLRPGTRIALVVVLLISFLPGIAHAHIGSPNVFFEGQAGPYPVHVVIRPAEVIPGLAEISVRVESGGVQRVTALPIKWNAGRKGAPPPDVARLVRGETNLYSAQLWFMQPGAQSVEVEVTGAPGTGRVTIPVDAVARRVLGMPKLLGGILALLGFALVSLLVSIVGAAVRESVLEPGLEPAPRRRWWARGTMVMFTALLVLLLWGGKHWWQAEAAEYRNNRLYRPVAAVAGVQEKDGHLVLRLEVPGFGGSAPLVPDHGKLMHLFVVREPSLDAFAHLHPIKRNKQTFESDLPDLPAGSYRLYADVTYETGFSDTLTATVEIPERPRGEFHPAGPGLSDPEDSWRISQPFDAIHNNRECHLAGDNLMTWLAPGRFVVNQPISLQFTVRDANGQPVVLEPYLGMRGHLALRREDGLVFTHLHPGGSASMAAMRLSVLRTEGKLPLQAAFGADEPICQLPVETARDQQWLRGTGDSAAGAVSFPYAFPRRGDYRLWVQVKVKGEVLTGVFDVAVE